MRDRVSSDWAAASRRYGFGALVMKREVGALCAAVAIAASPAWGATLQEEIARLLESHPQISAAENNLAAAGEGVGRAFADYLPRLAVFGDYGYESTDSPGLRSSGDAEFETLREKATVTLTQNLFEGFRTDANTETARLNRSVAEVALEATKQNLLFEATSAYFNVLRHAKLIELAISNERTIQLQLSLEDERVKRGAGITVDVLQAKSRLQIAKERRVAFEGNLQSAIARYVQVFDSHPEIGSMSMPSLPLALLPGALAEAEAIALEENPAVANSDREIDIAEERKRSARSPYFPRIDVVGEYNYEDDEAGVVGTRRDWAVKVQANWELFSGFATRRDSADAAFRYLATIDNRSFVNRKIVEDVRLAWEQLATARGRVVLLKNAVNIAIEVHSARRKLREAGQETALNVLDAENEVFNAQITAVDADFDRRIAVYRLILAIGRLKPQVL